MHADSRAVKSIPGSWSLGIFFSSSLPQAASCTGEQVSIVGQFWEKDRQNTPASQCHATEEVWEKYALK